MFLSIMACQLGGRKVDVNRHVLDNDAGSLPRLSKTGFETVYYEQDENPIRGLANAAKSKVNLFDASHIDTMIAVSTLFDSAPGWPHEIATALELSSSANIIKIQDACTGYVTALSVADGLLQSGRAKEILIVTCDMYSSYMSGDISLEILFSDSLTLSTLSIAPPKSHSAENAISLTLRKEVTQNKHGTQKELGIQGGKLSMNGAAVFQFAMESVPALVTDSLYDLGIELAEVSWFFHQGSRFVVDQLSKALGLVSEDFFRAVSYGNTVSGSLPFQLASHLPKNEYLGLVGFGMGLSAKVAIYEVGAA
jgi:3-oxoacyl-[acyl-carrier-protein] synthase III